MNANCCDPRTCAVALARWCLGMILLLAGIGKLPDVSGFVQNGIVGPFAKTWLPKWLLLPYGYALPFVETILGVWLILGVARNVALFIAGLLFLSLTFGQVLLGQPAVVFNNMVYTFFAAGVLFLDPYDRWICCGRKSEQPSNPS